MCWAPQYLALSATNRKWLYASMPNGNVRMCRKPNAIPHVRAWVATYCQSISVINISMSISQSANVRITIINIWIKGSSNLIGGAMFDGIWYFEKALITVWNWEIKQLFLTCLSFHKFWHKCVHLYWKCFMNLTNHRNMSELL